MAQEQQDQANTEISTDAAFAAEVDAIMIADGGYDDFVRALFNRCGDPAVDFTHAALGVSTEVFELLRSNNLVNSVEEAGDLNFYYIAATQVLRDCFPGVLEGVDTADEWETFHSVFFDTYAEAFRMPKHEALPYLLCELQDIAKRWVGYGRAPTLHPAAIVVLLGYTIGLAKSLAVGHRSLEDDDKVTRVNVAKLLDRYKGKKFDAERAVNRDLDSERETLNAAVGAAG